MGRFRGIVYGIVAHCFGLLGFPGTYVWSLQPRYLVGNSQKGLVVYRLMAEIRRADSFPFPEFSLEERRQREKAELFVPF